MGHHLVAAVRPGGDDGTRACAIDRVGDAASPRPRRVRRQPLVLRHIRGRHALRAELRGGVTAARADQQRDRVAERARERERLQGQLVDLAALVLDQHQHAHHATPSSRITSTTAGAASGPRPRISACLPCPAGTTSRSFSSRESARAGVRFSTGFLRARSFAGTDG